MATSSDLSAFGLRASPFTRELDADLWLPEGMAALVADLSFAHLPSVLLLGEARRVRDDEEDDDGDLF